jgi:hypothetical protein
MMNEDTQKNPSPALIIGGFAGTGKTAVSRRLSAELGIPRLGSDTLGRAIKDSVGSKGKGGEAGWSSYRFALISSRASSGNGCGWS